jgi:hypothetical protein
VWQGPIEGGPPGGEDEGKSEGDDGVTVREGGLNFRCQILPFPPFLRGWEEPEKIWTGRRGRRGAKWAGGLSINSSIASDVTVRGTAIVRFTFYTDPTFGAHPLALAVCHLTASKQFI